MGGEVTQETELKRAPESAMSASERWSPLQIMMGNIDQRINEISEVTGRSEFGHPGHHGFNAGFHIAVFFGVTIHHDGKGIALT